LIKKTRKKEKHSSKKTRRNSILNRNHFNPMMIRRGARRIYKQRERRSKRKLVTRSTLKYRIY
jgi:hypothetical protein